MSACAMRVVTVVKAYANVCKCVARRSFYDRADFVFIWQISRTVVHACFACINVFFPLHFPIVYRLSHI